MPAPVGTDVERAAEILRDGGLVAFPTETVYGLGADATNPLAVARVFDVKDRPRFDPLIVHVAEPSWLPRIAAGVPPAATRLSEKFWPGPLTLVLPKIKSQARQEASIDGSEPDIPPSPLDSQSLSRDSSPSVWVIPDLVTAGLATVALRMPDHRLALELLRTVGRPVAAPSANLFGRLSPTTAAHVAAQLGGRIDYILDGGPCRVGVESTVLDLSGEPPRLLRAGGLPLEEIETVIGTVAVAESSPVRAQTDKAAPLSPGRLPSHYAPRTPLTVSSRQEAGSYRQTGFPGTGAPRVGLLTLGPVEDASRFAAVEVLSPSGDLIEAAANFFAALHRLDAQNLELIVAEPFPEQGLGRALNDRLRRAAHGR